MHLDVPYQEGGDPKFTLDLAFPSQPGPYPLVVFVHGGAWITGDKKDYRTFLNSFTRDGVAIAILNYRLCTPQNGTCYPTPLNDLRKATSWIWDHREEFAIGSIFLVGHSAGAMMVSTLGMEDSRFAGIVGLAGIYDLIALAKKWPSYPDWFLNITFGKDQSTWNTYSPNQMKKQGSRRWLLLHSTGDELVDRDQSHFFQSHLQKLGLSVQFQETNFGNHFEMVKQMGLRNSQVKKIILDWIKQ